MRERRGAAQSHGAQEWVDTTVGSLGIARPGLPIIVPVTEFRDIIGIALTNMINGADAATELSDR